MGDSLDFLTEMAEKGLPVPDLASRPELPDHLRLLMRVYNDLNTGEGVIRFSEYVVWCGTYGIQKSSIQFEFVWDVLCDAQNRLAKWKQKKDTSSKNSSQKPTDNTRMGQEP